MRLAIEQTGGLPSIDFQVSEAARAIFGEHEENLRAIEDVLKVKLSTRGTKLFIDGQSHDVVMVRKLLEQIRELQEAGHFIDAGDVGHAAQMLASGRVSSLKDVFLDKILVSAKRRIIAPKSVNQKIYIDAIRKNDVVFGIGPAGTGKTYLAVAMAVAALSRGDVERIILTRPAVEAGEKLGFLPGDLAEKINPYLRPLYDALNDMLSPETVQRHVERDIIEVAPLAFMRGRTLNDAFVIFDEAQNSTPEQMKMFLTRLGFNSKAVITGDVTQIDLARGAESGLVIIQRILQGLPGLAFIHLSKDDVVRHPLVQAIIQAYDDYQSRMEGGPATPASAPVPAASLPVSDPPEGRGDEPEDVHALGE